MKRFETEFIAQGPYESRSLYDSLALAWRLLSLYPQESLSKIDKTVLKTYYKKRLEEDPELEKFDKKHK